MPSAIATLKIKADKVEEAKTKLKELAAETVANEAGTLIYTVHQKKDDPETFVFYEKYESDEALAIHGENLKSKGAVFAALLAGPPDIVWMEEV